jgi:FtsP/CotA-like multicopper oxidase with cupredoxin domain
MQEPYQTKVVTLAAGQRTDVVVEATGSSGSSYWMRLRQPDLCNNVIQPFALAALYYDGADVNSIPWSISQPDFLTPRLRKCNNDPIENTIPVYPIAATSKPDVTVSVNMSTAFNAQNQTVFEMNGVAFHGNYGDPILSHAVHGNATFSPQWNVFDFSGKQSIRLIFINSQPFAHPMHVHGQQMSVLAVGQGNWNGSVVRPSNPQRRDTQLVPANGHLVVELTGNNPGVWPLHCHKSWHLSSGQMINLLFAREELKAMNVPAEISAGCLG